MSIRRVEFGHYGALHGKHQRSAPHGIAQKDDDQANAIATEINRRSQCFAWDRAT